MICMPDLPDQVVRYTAIAIYSRSGSKWAGWLWPRVGYRVRPYAMVLDRIDVDMAGKAGTWNLIPQVKVNHPTAIVVFASISWVLRTVAD